MCYNEFTTVSSLKQVVNWSFLFEESGCLKKLNAMSQYRFVKLESKSVTAKNKEWTVHSLGRGTFEDPWIDKQTVSGPYFLNFVADITKTHSEQLTEPPDFGDETIRIEWEESSISIASNLRSLVCLRNVVYRTRFASIGTWIVHWKSSIGLSRTSIRHLLHALLDQRN